MWLSKFRRFKRVADKFWEGVPPNDRDLTRGWIHQGIQLEALKGVGHWPLGNAMYGFTLNSMFFDSFRIVSNITWLATLEQTPKPHVLIVCVENCRIPQFLFPLRRSKILCSLGEAWCAATYCICVQHLITSRIQESFFDSRTLSARNNVSVCWCKEEQIRPFVLLLLRLFYSFNIYKKFGLNTNCHFVVRCDKTSRGLTRTQHVARQVRTVITLTPRMLDSLRCAWSTSYMIFCVRVWPMIEEYFVVATGWEM